MIGEWIAENAGTALSIASAVYIGASWILVHWLGDRFEPKKIALTEKQKQERVEEIARSVLSTSQLSEFTGATIGKALKSNEFWDATEGVVTRSKMIQEFVDNRCKHVFTSHESAIRIIISDATKAVGDQLQKSLTDSQAMFMSELRGMRSDMAENMKAISEHVGELDTALQVHKAHDDAKRS